MKTVPQCECQSARATSAQSEIAPAMQTIRAEGNLIQLDNDPKSTFQQSGEGFSSSYDHIFVVADQTPEYVEGTCDTVNVCKFVYGDDTPANMRKARRELSDHLPVFAVFDVSGEDDDGQEE